MGSTAQSRVNGPVQRRYIMQPSLRLIDFEGHETSTGHTIYGRLKFQIHSSIDPVPRTDRFMGLGLHCSKKPMSWWFHYLAQSIQRLCLIFLCPVTSDVDIPNDYLIPGERTAVC